MNGVNHKAQIGLEVEVWSCFPKQVNGGFGVYLVKDGKEVDITDYLPDAILQRLFNECCERESDGAENVVQLSDYRGKPVANKKRTANLKD